MFCCLYLLNSGTGIPGHKNESCYVECPYYNQGKRFCGIMSHPERSLSTSKYSWMIHQVIEFPKDYVIQLGALDSAIQIVHPAEADFWVVKSKKNESFVYKLYLSKKSVDFVNLDALHSYLLTKGYDGRKITDLDFQK